MIPHYIIHVRQKIGVTVKSIAYFPTIFFIFQQLQSQISQNDKNGFIGFCKQIL